MNEHTERLEELRAIIRDESLSMGELVELQGLAEFIEPGDVELLEWAGVPEFPEIPDLPLPGDEFEGRTVVASGWHTDYIWAIMSLNDEAPYYRVDEVPLVEIDPEQGGRLTRYTHEFGNIVPAAQFFDEQFGLWGG